MPGRTPREAFEAFCEPLRRSLACLGHGKITPSSGGQDNPGKVHVWSLNGREGITSQTWNLRAQMHYEFVRCDEGWRVTTKAYRYKLASDGQDLFRIHWHPWGKSPYKLPHIHAHLCGPMGELTSLDKHLPTGRMAFEDAVEWSILLGMPAARDDWPEVLQDCKQRHLNHRTWADQPPLDSPA